jgi:hypothetical protein
MFENLTASNPPSCGECSGGTDTGRYCIVFVDGGLVESSYIKTGYLQMMNMDADVDEKER